MRPKFVVLVVEAEALEKYLNGGFWGRRGERVDAPAGGIMRGIFQETAPDPAFGGTAYYYRVVWEIPVVVEEEPSA